MHLQITRLLYKLFEGNDLNGYWVYKYKKDSHKIVGPVYIYSDATKSYLKEVYYFINNSNNIRYIKYHDNGSLRATGTLLGDMALLSNQIYVDHTTIFEAATTTNNNIYGSQLPKLPRIGVNKSYYKNGNINAITNYSNGEFNGQYLKYSENGLLQIEGNYQNGSENGLWKYYYYTPQGELEDIIEVMY